MNEIQRAKMLNALTDYDRKQSTKKHYNHYALGHYCGALNKVCKHVENGADLRVAILNCFCGQLCNVVLRSVKLPTMTDSEKQYGGFPTLPELDEDE